MNGVIDTAGRQLKPYAEYEASSVPWTPTRPKSWRYKRVKHEYSVRLGKMLQSSRSCSHDSLVPYLRSANVLWEGVSVSDIKEMYFSPSELLQYKLEKDDLVVCEGGDVGRAAIWRAELPEVYIQNAVHRVRSRGNSLTSFLYYWLYFAKYTGFIDVLVERATIGHLTEEKLREIPFPCPTPSEQREIVRFLDRETAKIDALIAKREQLIVLLEEKRAALISHAVTKGLDPSVQMKKSGIDWLGELPHHWTIEKVKYLSKIIRGQFTHRPRNDPRMYDGPYPFIQTGDVASATKYIREYHQTLSEEGFRVSKQFPKGTLVMTIAANIGDMAILDFEACFPDSIVGFAPRRDVDIEYLYYLLIAMRQELRSIAPLNTQLNLNIERVGSLPAPCPPPEEQLQIAKYIERKLAPLLRLREKIEAQFQQLNEYRKALISAAITGKIDVRGEVA